MLPVIQKNNVHESSGILETVGFTAKVENLGVLFHILRNQLYSDPILAVLREISTNAVDANVMAGKPEVPIRVTLPTLLESFLKIRDFGNGLSDEQVKDIFCSYGESTKRQTNDATGMLGIGCKSPFSYTDSFTVNSYQNGKMKMWNAHIDPSNRGAMALMAECDTTEPDGIEVVVPVKTNDISKFKQKAFHLFAFFSLCPDIKNVDSYELSSFQTSRVRKPMHKADDWEFIGGSHTTSYAVMGNIPYPIDPHVFTEGEIKTELRTLLQYGVIINFKIGTLEFAASREALQYTPQTKKTIVAKLTEIYKALGVEAEKEFAACKTLWDAKCMHAEVCSNPSHKLNVLMNLLKVNIKFNGQSVNSASFGKGNVPFEIACYGHNVGAWNRTQNRVGREVVNGIEVRRLNTVVINDKAIVNAIINRVVGQIEDKKMNKVFVLKFNNDEDRDKWLQESAYDGPLIKLSDLPKEQLSKYYPDLAANKLNGFNNPKNAVKEFEFTAALNGNMRSRTVKSSDYWTITEVDPEKDSGVYVPIDRYEFKGRSNYMEHPSYLVEYINKLKNAGVNVPKVYGFKLASTEIAEKNPNMVNFWKWAQKALQDLLNNDKAVQQDYVDAKHISETYRKAWFDYLFGNQFRWKVTNMQSPFMQFVQKGTTIWGKRNGSKYDVMKAAIEFYGISTAGFVAPTMDITKLVEEMRKRYPLVFHYMDCNHYGMTDAKVVQDFSDYINDVDVKNP